MLDLPVWVWIATVGGLGLVIAFDFYIVVRKPH